MKIDSATKANAESGFSTKNCTGNDHPNSQENSADCLITAGHTIPNLEHYLCVPRPTSKPANASSSTESVSKRNKNFEVWIGNWKAKILATPQSDHDISLVTRHLVRVMRPDEPNPQVKLNNAECSISQPCQHWSANARVCFTFHNSCNSSAARCAQNWSSGVAVNRDTFRMFQFRTE